jgi:hypothetical protein
MMWFESACAISVFRPCTKVSGVRNAGALMSANTTTAVPADQVSAA